VAMPQIVTTDRTSQVPHLCALPGGSVGFPPPRAAGQRGCAQCAAQLAYAHCGPVAMGLVTQTEAAKLLGVHRRGIDRKKEGLLRMGQAVRMGGRIMYESEGLEAAYLALAEPQAGSKVGRDLQAEAEQLEEEGIPALHISKARREFYLAELAEIEAKRRAGELIEAAKVETALFTTSRGFRDALLARPSQWAPELAGVESVGEVAIILERQVHSFLVDFSDPERGFEGQARRGMEEEP
jgi:hypothetical protein